MAILGNVIKGAIALKQELTPEIGNPQERQEKQLRSLLERAKDTAFGTYYGFKRILKADDIVKAYQESVPLHQYDDMNEQWWQQQQREENITWRGKPDYWALSAGTTSDDSKRLPVTDDLLASIRSVGLEQFTSLVNFDLPSDFFEREFLMLGSSTNLKERNGHLEGEISGISASNLPSWFSNFYKPGLEISAIDDWDERVLEIALQAPAWDVAGLSGIPSWVQLMLKKVIEVNELKHIHELWPNLQVYTTGGVAFKPYEKSFNTLLGRPINILDTYLASEGFFAYTARPDTMSMKLAISNQLFFEFIPFNSRGFDKDGNLLANPEVLPIHEVEEGQDYALIISSPAGAWRYMIGDTIKFTDVEKLELIISGRTKFFLNVVGSQLTEEQLNIGISTLAETLGVKIDEFTVAALERADGEYLHQWVVGSDDEFSEEEASKQLDTILQERNKAYRMARTKALKAIQIKRIPKDIFYNWLENRKKKGGQVKTPKVMKEEQMRELLEFIGQAEVVA